MYHMQGSMVTKSIAAGGRMGEQVGLKRTLLLVWLGWAIEWGKRSEDTLANKMRYCMNNPTSEQV